jgi:drug/metabolite transporter (DMT)-like permease
MSIYQFAALVSSSILAAIGQVMLKIGSGQVAVTGSVINIFLATGLALYALGLALWLYGLSAAPLLVVYPFTLLTFVIVGLLSVFYLGESFSFNVALGWLIIITGVLVIFFASK